MICQSCKDRSCEDCLSVSCTCGHDKSTVRPLTHRERQEFVNGDRSSYLLPKGSPYVPPAPKEIAKGLASVFHTLAVSTAMGAMYKGDLDGARTQLDNLPDEQLSAVSVAASALASLAEEIAGERSQ